MNLGLGNIQISIIQKIQKMDFTDIRIGSHRSVLTARYLKKDVDGQPTKPTTTNTLATIQTKQKETESNMNGFAKGKDYSRYKRLSNICMILIGFKVFLCFIYVHLALNQYQFDHLPDIKTDWILIMSFILHCYVVGLRLVIEKMRNERMQIIQKLSYSYHQQLFKILISFPIAPQPWLEDVTFEVQYSTTSGQQDAYPFKINYLILIPSIIDAVVVIIRILILNTVYYSPRAQRIGKIYQIHNHGELYVIKCIVKENPLSAFALMTIMVLLLSAFCLKIVEGDVPIDKNPFNNYQSCFWFIGITVTAVGYGDIYPVSDLGHIMVCFCCIWSCFNTSVITFLLVSNLSLRPNQQRCLQILKNVEINLQRKKMAKQYLRITLYRLMCNKKYKLKFRESLKEKKLRGVLFKLRFERSRSLSLLNLAEQMEKEFTNALINITSLTHNNKKQLDFIANTYFISSKVVIMKENIKTYSDFFKKHPVESEENQDKQSVISITKNMPEDLVDMYQNKNKEDVVLQKFITKRLVQEVSKDKLEQQDKQQQKDKEEYKGNEELNDHEEQKEKVVVHSLQKSIIKPYNILQVKKEQPVVKQSILKKKLNNRNGRSSDKQFLRVPKSKGRQHDSKSVKLFK